MNLRRVFPFLFLVLGVGLWAKDSMKNKTEATAAAPAGAACAVGEKSACGLPSNVVIDMSKATVQKSTAEWKKILSPEAFRVARQQGTEPPFHNAYWNNHEDGVYFSVCSDTPLFDSRD